MTTTTIVIPDKDYKVIKELADLEGVSVPAYMSQVILDQIEDVRDYKEAMSVLNEHNGTVSRAEVMNEVLDK